VPGAEAGKWDKSRFKKREEIGPSSTVNHEK